MSKEEKAALAWLNDPDAMAWREPCRIPEAAVCPAVRTACADQGLLYEAPRYGLLRNWLTVGASTEAIWKFSWYSRDDTTKAR